MEWQGGRGSGREAETSNCSRLTTSDNSKKLSFCGKQHRTMLVLVPPPKASLPVVAHPTAMCVIRMIELRDISPTYS